ncbi:reverse transcriptase domain-containing protein, partial [Tanacetum coccineum]
DLLTKIVLGAETVPAAPRNHTIILAPPTGRVPNIDIGLMTEPALATNKEGGKVNPRYPAYRRAAPAMEDTGSQNQKGASLRTKMTWRYPGYAKRWIRSHPKSAILKVHERHECLTMHVNFFQAATQVERWAMPTWYHMFNSTLIGTARVWFDELPLEKIDGYKDLKATFLADFMQQKKYVKDPVETGRMKGALEWMRIFGFMHGVNNPELTKRLNEHVPKTMEEMMIVTTAFIRGETDVAGKKKAHTSWRAQDQSKRHASEQRSDFRGQPSEGRGSSRFTPLQEHPKKSSRPKRESSNRHHPWLPRWRREVTTSFVTSTMIKDTARTIGKDQPKARKKEVPAKDKSMVIYMVQPWHKMTRQKVTQSFEHVSDITFPSLTTSSGTKGPLVIEAEIGRHIIHRMCVDGAHGMLKFPADGGIVTIRSTILIPAECTTEVAIGGTLSAKGRTKLCSLLKENLDIFAWQPLDMTRVPQSIAEHRLNIQEGYSPVRQKKRGQALERAKAIQMETIKEVQSLNGKLASLNRFLSKSAEKSLPLFKTLKKCIKKSDFDWTPKAEQAFKQLKQHLSELPLLVAPKPIEELIIYMSASYGAISAVLMTERGTAQTPIYFVSHALQGPELNYTLMEKLILSMVFAAKRLRRYFQVHPIVVITDQPIKQIMSRPDVAGRLQTWSVMLGEHNITYRLRASVKGQILADFLVEKIDEGPTETPMVETPQEP